MSTLTHEDRPGLLSTQDCIEASFSVKGSQQHVCTPYAEHRTGKVGYWPIANAVAEATGNDKPSTAALADLLALDHPLVHALKKAACAYWIAQHRDDIAEYAD